MGFWTGYRPRSQAHCGALLRAYEHRGALRGTPGSAYPGQIPLSCPVAPQAARRPLRLRPRGHAPRNTSLRRRTNKRLSCSGFGKNPGLGHFGLNRPKVATSVPSTCGQPSPCAVTSFCHPRECRALQPPSDFQLILSTRTDVTLALILGPSFYSLLTPSRLGRAHTSTCPAAASRPAHSALDRLGTPGCVGSGQRC